MADSDEESERQGSRDKFRRERSEFESRRRPGDKREPFDDRSGNFNNIYARDDHRNTGESRQFINERRRSPLAEPPFKRAKREQNEDYRGTATKRRDTKNSNLSDHDAIYRPPVMPFKRFLDPLDDLITEDEACSKYKDYKGGYLKKHIEEFFELHKNEEWLRLRYHPDHMESRKQSIIDNVKYRLNIFMDLLKKGFFENQVVQMDNSENLIKLMDAVVIKLEGGTDEDLNILEEVDRNRFSDDDGEHHRSTQVFHSNNSGHKSEGEAESDIDADDSDKESFIEKAFVKSNQEPAQFTNQSIAHNHDQSLSNTKEHSHSESSSSSDGSSDSSSDGEPDHDELQCAKNAPDGLNLSMSTKEERAQAIENYGSLKEADDDDDDVPTPTTAEAPEGGCPDESTLPTPVTSIILNSSIQPTIDVFVQQQKVGDQNQEFKGMALSGFQAPRPLHKTASIFFRALPPTLKEAELREVCATQPGFIRLALWEPAPERRFMRHAWATYESGVNIKKVCWALNTSPLLRDKVNLPNGELGATVNRDLAQRVRPLNPLTRHKPVMRQDLLLAAQLISQLDLKYGLWMNVEEGGDSIETEKNSTTKSEENALELAIKSKNPLLKNLTDYLVDEGGSEEEALIAETNPTDNGESVDINGTGRSNSISLESDSNLARILDLLILYLRIVHSVDYYAAAIYPMEELMPHRCGILHARGDRGLNSSINIGRTNGLTFNQREIDEYLQNFTLKIRALINVPKDLRNAEMKKLGMRDPEKAAEDFVEANIQKRTGKKKPFKVVWVCPLSDKKFREPIFVRKHIFNKHMEKIEAAKKDNAIFFNNYLRDPRRPSLPEAPYYLINQYYPPSGIVNNNNPSFRGQRGSGRGMGYRGGYRQNNSNSLFAAPRNTGHFQDYYDVAAQQQQHQAMAAVAAAAAALYPGATAADLYTLAAGSCHRNGARRGRISPQHHDYNSRSYGLTDSRRRQPINYGGNRRLTHGSGERSMISYNDLDEPVNDAI